MSLSGFEHLFPHDKSLPIEYDPILEAQYLTISYAGSLAVNKVSLAIPPHEVTAIIGTSGSGKSTLLRSFNRMNDTINGVSVEGNVYYHGVDIYEDTVDPVEVRRHIGMVFQKPNPFPKSIYDNVAFGPKVIMGQRKSEVAYSVEEALRNAALWDSVKDRLGSSALKLSGGEQQRLCIARTLAVQPDVVLMDEPCSSLDPIATGQIEELIMSMAEERTVVLVTHDMREAARVADRTAFMSVEYDDQLRPICGYLEEFDISRNIFTNPASPKTEGYVTGKSG